MKEITNILAAWEAIEARSLPAVLATVVKVEGSHYRRPGARMFLSDTAEGAGTVSGGCLEEDLRQRVTEVLRSGRTTLVSYDTTSEDDLFLGTGMGCGGKVAIMLQPARSSGVRMLMEAAKRCQERRQRVAAATVFRTEGNIDTQPGDVILLDAEERLSSTCTHSTLGEKLLADLQRVRLEGGTLVRSCGVREGTCEVLLESIRPAVLLVLFGAGDDARPVCRFAAELGWRVMILDHRAALLTPERFPNAERREWRVGHEPIPPEVLDADAVVVMTHNYLTDLELLRLLLPSNIPYIGLLGARRRAARLVQAVSELGSPPSPPQLARLHAPVGLDLGSESPAEIALAIIAEIQAELAGGSRRPLREYEPGTTTAHEHPEGEHD